MVDCRPQSLALEWAGYRSDILLADRLCPVNAVEAIETSLEFGSGGWTPPSRGRILTTFSDDTKHNFRQFCLRRDFFQSARGLSNTDS